MTGNPDLGRRIRRHREARHLTQQELADALGVTVRSVGNWELGKHHPRSHVGAIEALWGVDLEASAADVDDDPVLVAIAAAGGLSEDSKAILSGTYRNLLRDDARRGEAS